MDEKQKQEMKEKAKAVAAETADLAKEVGKAAAAKADELYNKLPLDKINEKLGGKVDVKTTKFKIIATVILVIILLLGIKLIFGGDSLESRIREATNLMIQKDPLSAAGHTKCVKVSDIKITITQNDKKAGTASAHIRHDEGKSTVPIEFEIDGKTCRVSPRM